MEHYSSEQWADYVRNVLKEKDHKAMQAHLDTGCGRCTEAVSTWTRFRQAASRESGYQPPEGAVRTAKAFLATHLRPARPRLAQLLFDSLKIPALAGVRSSTAPARVMLYGIGDYRIDLRMESKPVSKISLIGQILISSDPAHPAARVPVTLVSGNMTAAVIETNEFGEFTCECEAEDNLSLQFTLPDATHIKIPLLQPSLSTLKTRSEAPDSAGVKARRNLKRKRTGKKEPPKGD